MKFFEADFTYSHSWDKVTTAIWKKYPNDKANHVIGVDTLKQSIDPQTGVLTVERLLTCKQNIPYLLQQIMRTGDTSYVLELSTIDPRSKTFTANSVNLSYNNLMTVEESVTYKPDPSLPKTLFQQQARITALGVVSRAANYVEDFSVKRFQANAAVATLVNCCDMLAIINQHTLRNVLDGCRDFGNPFFYIAVVKMDDQQKVNAIMFLNGNAEGLSDLLMVLGCKPLSMLKLS